MAARSWIVAVFEAFGRAISWVLTGIGIWLRNTWLGRRSGLGGARLLALGLALGFGVGWMSGWRIKYYVHPETELPKPVTDPPVGMQWVRVLTTGYCPCTICCGPNANGRTSINRDVKIYPFGIASDHGLVPTHTHLDIPGYGFAEIDDTGGAMRQDAKKGVVHLDLRFTNHEQARRWGRRWMWIALPLSGAKPTWPTVLPLLPPTSAPPTSSPSPVVAPSATTPSPSAPAP